jgi:hypothetical protein
LPKRCAGIGTRPARELGEHRMTGSPYLFWALAAALLAPLALIVTRNELRKVRYRLVEELRVNIFKSDPNLPQLELAAARYRAGRDEAGETRQAAVQIWTGAFIFAALCFAGFSILLVPTVKLISGEPTFPQVTSSLLWSQAYSAGSLEPLALAELARTLTIAGIAFLGGYVFQVRYLIRATLNQELGALAFVRATLNVLQGMIVALIAYRVEVVLIDGAVAAGASGKVAAGATGAADAVAGAAAGPVAFAAAMAVAFVLGLYPNLGLNRISKIAKIRWKEVDEVAMGAAKLVPLQVIDGIDSETAYRLEESNLYDVQNLATVNPISLYAESPYPLLEVFDWVLQAQLCANVGTRAFIALREHKVRTIFDLERAVLAQGAPPEYVRAIGALLFADATPAFRVRIGLSATPEGQAAEGEGIGIETVRHAVAIMCDDLHVHRVRALWRVMLQTTMGRHDGDSPWLHETGPLPGDPPPAATSGGGLAAMSIVPDAPGVAA